MRYILILLWLVLGLGYFLLANSYCKLDNELSALSTEIKANVPMAPVKIPCPEIGPFSFKTNSIDLITGSNWSSFKDSLISIMTTDNKIQIVGLQEEGERIHGIDDVGMTRANMVSKLFGLEDEKLQIYSSKLAKLNYKEDCLLPAARIKLVTVTEKIKEIQDRTLIYFPYNSTNKLNDAEVENYLDALAMKIIKTGEKVKLTGHTDDKGDPKYNLELGQSRAEVIKSYLMLKGVLSKNILTLSKGETLPIADNGTENGRAQNRRTELEIIK